MLNATAAALAGSAFKLLRLMLLTDAAGIPGRTRRQVLHADHCGVLLVRNLIVIRILHAGDFAVHAENEGQNRYSTFLLNLSTEKNMFAITTWPIRSPNQTYSIAERHGDIHSTQNLWLRCLG